MRLISIVLLTLFLNSAHPQSGWVAQNFPNRNFMSVNFVNLQTGFIISSKGYIEKTTNGGVNWIELNTGLPGFGASLRSGFFHTADLGVVNSYAGINTSTDGGYNWYTSFPPGEGIVGIQKSLFINAETGFSCGSDFILTDKKSFSEYALSDYFGVIYKTTNTGSNWETVYRSGANDCQDLFCKSVDSISVLSFTLLKTTNSGINWVSSNFDVTPSIYPRSFTNPYFDTIFVCASAGRIVRSTNRGVNWSYVYSNPQYYYLTKISFLNSKTGYCAGDSGLVLYTSNAGESWVKQNTNTSQRLWDVFPMNKDTIYVVGDSGTVLRTYTGGLVSVTLHNQNIAEEFSLSQNYPNPFNPLTVISYRLSIAGNVNLNIYDVNGKFVKELVTAKQNAGNYEVNFSGEGLASGVYYYSLIAEGEVIDTKKMILLK